MRKKEEIQRLKERQSVCEKEVQLAKAEALRAVKIVSCPKHNLIFDRKSKRGVWSFNTFYEMPEHTIFFYKCSCGLTEQKLEADLTTKQKSALKELGLL